MEDTCFCFIISFNYIVFINKQSKKRIEF